jgi:hypothetical protein
MKTQRSLALSLAGLLGACLLFSPPTFAASVSPTESPAKNERVTNQPGQATTKKVKHTKVEKKKPGEKGTTHMQ